MVEEKKIKKAHSAVLECRRKLTLTGVSEVEDFDAAHVSAATDYGVVTVRGSELKIGKLSVEAGELSVEGKIEAVFYSEEAEEKKSFLSRLFK
ncbi:MAG: sporulation protein YabP [Clostridia bacterium]|nr:sporulation protein YabP [Clostridia bacterium]MBR2327608.1 sporulation protein YabP [Clostridia bacterium]